MTAPAVAVGTNFTRLATGLDVAPLVAALERQPALWGELTFRQAHPASPHRATEAIYLTYCESITVDAVFTDLRAVPYPALARLPEVLLLLDDIAALAGATARGRAMIVNLKPDGHITPHADEGVYADFYERFHLCLAAAPGNLFECAGELVQMRPGELWWFNHKRAHAVANYSDAPRWHLIVDLVAPAYRVERDAA